jgi:hypothetical protein
MCRKRSRVPCNHFTIAVFFLPRVVEPSSSRFCILKVGGDYLSVGPSTPEVYENTVSKSPQINHRLISETVQCNYIICFNLQLWVRELSRYSDWLRAGRSGDRIPVGARFSAPVQTRPGAHPASCTMGTGSSPGVESGRGMTLTPHPLLVPRSKNRLGLYLYSP